MMPTSSFTKSSTPVSTISSANMANSAQAVQSGPYTKTQFQSTMDGSRSVKNAKEVEQLLRDYPAALELYRTGRYKVKLKNEADIERVILVEKRTNKNVSNTLTKSNESQQINQSNLDISTIHDKQNTEKTRSRTHSNDRVAPSTSATDSNALVQTTTSSTHTLNHGQPKVDNHRISSKEREPSLTSQAKQQQKQQTSHRSESREDNRSKVSHSKHKGKKSHRDQPRAIVPYVPNAHPSANMWHQSRALQPYYSHPILPNQQPVSNMYMPTPYGPQQNPIYQQSYYYGQPPFPAIDYQKQSTYPSSSQVKSAGNINNQTFYPSHNHPFSSSKGGYNSNFGQNLPPSYHTFHTNQQQYPPHNAMYQSHMPYQTSGPWSTNKANGYGVNNHAESRRSSKHRARSVETNSRRNVQVQNSNQQQQQQPAATVTEHHHHRHHHHHRNHPTNVPNTTNGAFVEVGKTADAQLKETAAPVSVGNPNAPAEKLTIRQLNEIFLQMDPAGRLPYGSLPNILQRFGIALSENDLASAAQSLGYNTAEAISARRLVHVLVKLGKIAKSAQQPQQQRTTASPSILPEDREVNDIMTHRRAAGAASTHIHSSIFPNRWY